LITRMIMNDDSKSWTNSFYHFTQSPVMCSLLGPYIFRSIISYTLSWCSCLIVRNQVWHPYMTTKLWFCLF
jgi:hypothetical protein